jgi:hypothetical protein
MRKGSPLFITGTARSGTTLLCYLLNANQEIMTAIDPYLPLFRSFRNAAIRQSGDAQLKSSFDYRSALSDYYFDDNRLQILDLIQETGLDIPFDKLEWDSFYKTSVSRMQIESGDLVPYLKQLQGKNYLDMFNGALGIIAQARNASTRSWIGFKEVWTIEFFAPLARAYPDARFVVIQRDPRAVMASMSALAKKDPSQKAHTLSFLRHWRKYAAFISHYLSHPLLAGRMHLLKYEDLVSEPEKSVLGLCEFLEVPFDAGMLDSSNYWNYTTGHIWMGNSSFEQKMTGIATAPLQQWKIEMDMPLLKTVEFICGPEMMLNGYTPVTDINEHPDDSEVLLYLLDENKKASSWRSDFGDIQLDYGFELFRRSLLKAKSDLGTDLIRRSFLFESVYADLCNYGN